MRAMALVGLCVLLSPAHAASEALPLYTAYLDPPLDARSPGNLTQKLAGWLSSRSGGRYHFVATQLPRAQLDLLIAQADWNGAVAWANPHWFNDPERKRFHWTAPFMLDSDLVVSQRRRPVEYLNEGRSLEGLRVGAAAGHRLVDLEWPIERGRLQRVDAAGELDHLPELKAGRLDAVLMQAISLRHFQRSQPDLATWLHVARQPRDTFWRHLFTAHPHSALHQFLERQLPALADDPVWQRVLPKPPRQLRLLSIDRLDSPYALALRRVLDAAFERAGLRYALSAVPAERAFVELREGRYDGDMARAANFGASLAGALRVGPPHSRALHLALAPPGGPRLQRWSDLQGLRVAVPRGFKQTEQLSRGIANRRIVEGVDACVRMVKNQRVHACLLPAYSLEEPAGRESPRGLEAQVLGTSELHLWLRAGLAEDARKLGMALAALEQEGELERLLGSYRAKRTP